MIRIAIIFVISNYVFCERSLKQLEAVIKVLEQQGRLHEVDSDLLKRINLALDRDDGAEDVSDKSPLESIRSKPRSTISAKHSFLERARQRQMKLFGSREKLRNENRFGSSSVEDKNQCQDLEVEIHRLEVENKRLKLRMMDLEEELELVQDRDCDHEPVSARHIAPASNPLDKLLQAASSKEELIVEPGIIISSSLVTPTPTISTIFSTVSSVDTSTVTHTTDLVVHYHGRPIPTQLLEEEVVTTTVTSTMSSTIEITPTPTWTFITITQTSTTTPSPPAAPAPAVDLLYQQKLEEERLVLLERIRSLSNPTPVVPIPGTPAVRAEVVEIPRTLNNVEALQKYMEEIRKLKKVTEKTIVAEPLISPSTTPSGPTTSVSTVYMSGSRPGEYSTSLVTVTLGLEDQTSETVSRQRRDIEPDRPAPVEMSILINPSDYSDTQLDSSIGHL